MFAGAGGGLGHPPPDSPTLDSSEQVYIPSVALLKMLKHGTPLSLSLYIEDSNRGAVLFCPTTKKKTLIIITWNLKP